MFVLSSRQYDFAMKRKRISKAAQRRLRLTDRCILKQLQEIIAGYLALLSKIAPFLLCAGVFM